MMRSMFAAVSSLRNHQTRMDTIGNNIANVNTTAFKNGRTTFQDVFYQTMSTGSAPTDDKGGVNPRQVGVGMGMNSIDTAFTQGNVEPTDNPTDLMIQGEGFFVLQDYAEDDANRFYTRAGAFGFDADGNLVNKSDGKFVVDAEGNPLTWDNMDTPDNIETISDLNTLDINDKGEIVGDGNVMGQVGIAKFDNNEALDKVGENQFTWNEAATHTPDGEDPEEPEPGAVGDADVGLSDTTIVPGALEMSNVELAKEFSDMITTQRGYQANARTITTSDEMLQELANLKR